MKRMIVAAMMALGLMLSAAVPAQAGGYPATARWCMGIPRSCYYAETNPSGAYDVNTYAFIGQSSGYGTSAEAWFWFYKSGGVVKCYFHEPMQKKKSFAHTCAGKMSYIEMKYDKNNDGAGRHTVRVSPDW